MVTDRWTDSYDKSVDYREIGDALTELVLAGGISERPSHVRPAVRIRSTLA